MSLDFSQKWIADIVSELFDKPASELTAGDMAKIKYLAFGESESLANGFFVEASLQSPPDPFINTDGGDEWILCLLGDSVALNKEGNIAKLVEEYKGKENAVLSMFGLENRDREWQEYAESKDARKRWREFSKSVKSGSHSALIDDDDKFERWYDEICVNAHKDIALFSGLEVLRVQGLRFPDLGFLDNLPDLRVLELVETVFESTEGIEKLTRLEQLACWRD